MRAMMSPGHRGLVMKRVAIYLRVSTSKQDTDNQRRELEAVAERSSWKVVKIYEDNGISGAKGRAHHRTRERYSRYPSFAVPKFAWHLIRTTFDDGRRCADYSGG